MFYNKNKYVRLFVKKNEFFILRNYEYIMIQRFDL